MCLEDVHQGNTGGLFVLLVLLRNAHRVCARRHSVSCGAVPHDFVAVVAQDSARDVDPQATWSDVAVGDESAYAEHEAPLATTLCLVATMEALTE